MALENSAGLDVLNSYGPRTTEGKFGGVIGDEVIKVVAFDYDLDDFKATTPAAVTGLDHVFPTGTVFLTCRTIGETSVAGATAVNIGTYLASDGITAVAATGLAAPTAAQLAANTTFVGAGASLTTGAVVTTAPTVVRAVSTVAAATAGKFRVIITYLAPTP